MDAAVNMAGGGVGTMTPASFCPLFGQIGLNAGYLAGCTLVCTCDPCVF